MKYIIRAVKYFLTLMVLLSAIILVLVKLGMVEGDISEIFVNGYDSLWQIAGLMAVFALIYPRFGYTHRIAECTGSPEETGPQLLKVMESHGYVQVEATDGMKFIKRSPLLRAAKLWEDAVVVTPAMIGYDFEGKTKDIVRLCLSLEAYNRENA